MKYRKEIMQIHRLAVPILMNYALTSVFEIFDEMIIGHYSVESFAFRIVLPQGYGMPQISFQMPR